MARKTDSETKPIEKSKILHAGFPPPAEEDVPDVLKRTPRPDAETAREEEPDARS
jgi:hypothetical protein